MDFTPDTITIMSYMMKSFKHFYKKNTPEKQEEMDTILKEIYKTIKKSETDIILLKKHQQVNKVVKEGRIIS